MGRRTTNHRQLPMKTITKLTLFHLSLLLAGIDVQAGGPVSPRPAAPKVTRTQPIARPIRQIPARQFQPGRPVSPFTPVGGRLVRNQERPTTVVTGAIPTRPLRPVNPPQLGVANSPTLLVPGTGYLRQPAIIPPQINTVTLPPGTNPSGNCVGVSGGGRCPTPRVSVTLIENLTATEADLQEAADLLRDAYVTLSKAAHVYKGRRAWAMMQTARAGALLGIRLCGDGVGDLSREESDQLLREAKGILERARDLLVIKSKPGAAQHVQNAINYLNYALALL